VPQFQVFLSSSLTLKHIPTTPVHFRVTVPAFWTNTSQITFNFTGFQPAYPGQALQYQWGLGTTPNSTNTIPFTTFTGDQILNTIFITNGQLLRNVTVFQQTYSLSNATALVEGQEYYVTVQAFCDESAAAATATQSAIVKVRLTSVVCGLLTSAMCDLLISVVCAGCLVSVGSHAFTGCKQPPCKLLHSVSICVMPCNYAATVEKATTH